MKKGFTVLLCCALLLFALTGCGGKGETKNTTASGETGAATAAVDIDLSKMSGTAVYSEVYNILNTPANYVGKLIKVKGQYNIWKVEETKMEYYAVVVRDALACCQQGIEFVLPQNANPDLKEGAEITVVGTFNTYYEGDSMYCHLEDSVLTVDSAAGKTAASAEPAVALKQAAVDIAKNHITADKTLTFSVKSFQNENAEDTGKLAEDGVASLYTVTLTAQTYTDSEDELTPVDFVCTVAVQKNGSGWFVEQTAP